MVTISSGTAKQQTGTFKIIHVINVAEYQEIANYIETIVQETFKTGNPILPFLINEIRQIRNHLDRLLPRPKNKRSLDFLGSAWKWIAGSPDRHDFEIMEEKINNVLMNNNNQLIINKLVIGKIKEVTNITNEIVNKLKSNDSLRSELLLELKFKLEILKEEIINVEYAVQWAKANIVNTYILSNTEVNIIGDILSKENMPYTNIIEAIEFSEIKIASNNTMLLYILSLPTTSQESCETTLIKSVKKGRIINKLEFKEILQCKDKIFGIKEPCKKFNTLSICHRNNIVDISNSSCIPNLLTSQTPLCTEINNQHIPDAEEISPGLILLNQFTGPIEIDENPLMLNGTFIIRFHNASIRIRSQIYQSFETSKHQPLPAILQPAAAKSREEELLSLQLIKELQFNNTNYIEQLKIHNRNNTIAMVVVSAFFIFLVLVRFWKKGLRNRIPDEGLPISEIEEIPPNIATNAQPQVPVSSTNTRISQIPLF